MHTSLHIGIDARLGGAVNAGIGRYIEELCRELFELPSQHRWSLFLRSSNQFEWLETSRAYTAGKVKVVTTSIRHYTVREQLFMPMYYAQQKLDVLHVPHFNVPLLYTKPFVVTIHDVLWHEKKDHEATTLSPWMHALKHTAYSVVSESAMKRARRVIVPSHEIERKVLAIEPHAHCMVLYEGVRRVELESWPQKNKHPFLLYIGSLYPHKNLDVVLRYLRQNPEIFLYVASARSVFFDVFMRQVKQLGVQARVKMLEYVPDGKLWSLAQQSVAVIQPSLSEGFGLTGLEALMYGVPVIASNIPVFKEIYGDLAVQFNPESVDELGLAVDTVVKNRSGIVKKIQKAQSTLAEKYSWKKMAQGMLSVYEQSA